MFHGSAEAAALQCNSQTVSQLTSMQFEFSTFFVVLN